ncbi:MAG: hypothetical protein HC866_07625 [Leptolyngbyaceae cyanobacterium RU_5_1]|nr:hypothetical protein [Leptolyngbyaceae cyanobacterium RU_5_1]
MAQSSGSSQPLNAGNVVSAAVTLYRSHLKQYLGISLIATLWVFLVFVSLIVLAIVAGIAFGVARAGESSGGAVIAVLISLVLFAGWVVLALYCIGKGLLNTALISRLAFSELADQPETMQAVRGQLNRKGSWRFLLTWFLAGLILFAINLGLSFAAAIPVLAVSAVAGEDSPVTVLVNLILQLVVVAVYYWFWARWFISEVPLAVESDTGSTEAISRSWELSTGSALRILLVLVVASIITLPLFILPFLPFIFTLIANAAMFADSSPASVAALVASVIGSLVIGILLFFPLNVFILPFWQAIKAVIYYDLRVRKEGLGMKLRGHGSQQ